LAKLRHQQQNPRQPLLAGVEKLIDQIRLGSHAAGQQKLQKQIGEGVLLVHHADHLRALDLERRAVGDGPGRRHPQAGVPAIDSSPTKSPAESNAMVASLPVLEITVSFARPL
jgi:hypothetical protein